MKNKKVIGVTFSIIAIGIVGMLLSDNNVIAKRNAYNKDVYEYGQEYAEKNLGNTEIYARGVVSKKEIEKRVESIEDNLDSGFEKDIKEISENEVRRQSLYLYACDKNYNVSDEELDEIINFIKKDLKGTEEEKIITDFIGGSGITQDEYWDMVREKYRVTETINKCLRDYEKEKIREKNIDPYDENYNNEIIKIDEELGKKAEKIYNIKVK